jgi:hypothetical protein
LLLGRCSRQLLKSCAGANMVYSRAKRVLILEHFFALKFFAAVREAFSSAYPGKVPSKTIYTNCLQNWYQNLLTHFISLLEEI